MQLVLRAGFQLARVFWWVRRPKTIGVRVIAHDGDNQVLLVRHTYGRRKDWYLPGGGIKRGETLAAAAIRELREEAGAVVNDEGSLSLLGVYANFHDFKNDYIATYIIGDWTAGDAVSIEIAECELFPCDELPKGTSDATRRRIDEWLGRQPITDLW